MTLKPQAEAFLALLRERGAAGVSAADAQAIGIWRAAPRVFELRAVGHDVQTFREHHADGWHARYILVGPVIADPIRGRQEAWTA